MGKKKVGKQRHDKYYSLAKEAGYRSRASFKLIQLNKKYKFLERSVCVVDLCAAPGGWLQAASQFMPLSKLLIGVDLVPIKPLPNVITIQGDITTDSCKSAIKRELQTWKADCVLHDGAPNVGKNWLHDAFQQVQLTLQALRLAVEILKPGGWFVTKIFRSKDYPALLDVMKTLFKSVHATKPQASRQESAEVFAVCQHFVPPKDMAALKFNAVFKDTPTASVSAKALEKRKRKAEGYADDAVTLFNKLDAVLFINSDNHLELLNDASELIIEDQRLVNHPSTTEDVKLLCRDLKVLNKKEVKELLKWRTVMKQHLRSLEVKPEEPKTESLPLSDDDAELEEVVKEEKRLEKRKRKKEFNEKRRYKKKLEYEMVLKDDDPVRAREPDLFTLQTISNKPKGVTNSTSSFPIEMDDDISPSSSSDKDLDEDEENAEWLNDVTTAVQTSSNMKKKGLAQAWFEKEAFKNLESENEDSEVDVLAKRASGSKAASINAVDDTQEDVEVFDEQQDHYESDSELVDNDSPVKKAKQKLDAEALAMGEVWMHSSKKRRQLVEAAINRFCSNDPNLPDWFLEDENKHCRQAAPVEKEIVDKYKMRQMTINARTIKKVAEAKFRKKRRAAKRMESAKKKAENIFADEGLTDVEKRRELKKVYKSCKDKRRKVTYVVAKKGGVQSRAHVKGRYKMVDRRMKKDLRKVKMARDGKKGKSRKR